MACGLCLIHTQMPDSGKAGSAWHELYCLYKLYRHSRPPYHLGEVPSPVRSTLPAVDQMPLTGSACMQAPAGVFSPRPGVS